MMISAQVDERQFPYSSEREFGRFDEVASLEDRLFATAIMHSVSKEDVVLVQIISADFELVETLSNVLQGQGIETSSSRDFVSIGKNGVLMVDIDSLGGILRVIDQLLAFRVANPSHTLILLSADFQQDEFDAIRMWVCDASLKLPITFSRLEQALVEADLNNMVWQDRCQDAVGHPWAPLALTR